VLLLVQQQIFFVWSADAGFGTNNLMLSFVTAPHQAQSPFASAANGYFSMVQAFVGVATECVKSDYTLAHIICVFLLSFQFVQSKYE